MLNIKDLTLRYDRRGEEILKSINLEIDGGQLIALVGESGSGKSTLLRAIAGLEKPSGGQIEIGDKKVFDAQENLAPQDRKVGMVFQEYALFPHLTVAENIRYGVNKRVSIEQLLEMVGLQGFDRRYPHELSGGEQQRVAIARALAPEPLVLLLDEPFSNLDEALKDQVREDIIQILRKANKTAILVTHDTRDAMATADQIIVLQDGIVQQFAAPQEIYDQPANAYVARFFGKTNLLSVIKAEEENILTPIGRFPLKAKVGQQLLIRPENWKLCSADSDHHPIFKAKVKNKTYLGAFTEWKVEIEEEVLILHTINDFKPTAFIYFTVHDLSQVSFI